MVVHHPHYYRMQDDTSVKLFCLMVSNHLHGKHILEALNMWLVSFSAAQVRVGVISRSSGLICYILSTRQQCGGSKNECSRVSNTVNTRVHSAFLEVIAKLTHYLIFTYYLPPPPPIQALSLSLEHCMARLVCPKQAARYRDAVDSLSVLASQNADTYFAETALERRVDSMRGCLNALTERRMAIAKSRHGRGGERGRGEDRRGGAEEACAT